MSPSLVLSFRKHLVQLDKASLQDIDLCDTVPVIDLMELEHSAAVQKHDLYRLFFRADKPVFPHSGPLVLLLQ